MALGLVISPVSLVSSESILNLLHGSILPLLLSEAVTNRAIFCSACVNASIIVDYFGDLFVLDFIQNHFGI